MDVDVLFVVVTVVKISGGDAVAAVVDLDDGVASAFSSSFIFPHFRDFAILVSGMTWLSLLSF